MIVTVPAGNIPYTNGSTSAVEMRIFASDSFVDGDGNIIVRDDPRGDDFYKSVAVSAVGDVLTYDGFTISSTDDIDYRLHYSFALFDASGRHLRTIFRKIRVPAITPRTFQQLYDFTQANKVNFGPEDTYYTAKQMDTALGNLVGASPKANEVTYGATKLSKAPTVSGDPVAVSASEAFYQGVKDIKYLAGYASLAAAISAIGSTPTELKVTTAVSVPADATTPATTLLSFEGNGKLTVAAGKTLTIGKMKDPGNVQVFDRADNTANIQFAAGAVERMNVKWLASSTVLTDTLNQYLASVSANGFGHIYIPAGTYSTAGDHEVVSGLIVSGDGQADISGTQLRATVENKPIFKIGNTKRNVIFNDIKLDGRTQTGAVGVLCAGSSPNTSAWVSFNNVRFVNFQYGFNVDSTDGIWQVAAINFDSECLFDNNSAAGIRCDTVNNALNIGANFYIPHDAWAVDLVSSGVTNFYHNEFGGSGYIGSQQIESQTVVAAAGITVSGAGKSVVTWAGLVGSPLTVNVALTTTEHTTATLIAAAYRKALAANTAIAALFHVGGSGADVKLIAIDRLANDVTANFTIENNTCSGITDSTTSTSSQAGAVDTGMSEGVVKITNAHGGPVNFFGTQDEALKTFIKNDASDYNGVINIFGGAVQSAIRLNESTNLNIIGTSVLPKTIRDSSTFGSSLVHFQGHVKDFVYDNSFTQIPVEARADNFGLGGNIMASAHKDIARRFDYQQAMRIFETTNNQYNAALGMLDLMSIRERPMLRLGRGDEAGNALFYYTLSRNNTNGRMIFAGNQTGFVGYDFDGDIKSASGVTGTFVQAPRHIRNTSTVVTPGATPAINWNSGDRFTFTPDQNCTISMSNMTAGQSIILDILTSGSSSYTITFDGVKTPGTLATGVTSGKVFSVRFHYNGTHIIEDGRTTAL